MKSAMRSARSAPAISRRVSRVFSCPTLRSLSIARSTSTLFDSKPEPLEEGVENAPVGEVDGEALHAQRPHALPHEEQDFQVCRSGVRADHVEIHLDELAVASPLGVLPAPHLCRVPAPEGQGKLREVRGHEPRKGDRQVEAQRHVAVSVVAEPVHLLVRLAAPLAEEHLGVLEDRRIDGGKGEQPEDFLQLSQDCEPLRLPLGQEVAEALEDARFDEVLHTLSSFR